jgi:hypothetical protein
VAKDDRWRLERLDTVIEIMEVGVAKAAAGDLD